MKEITMEFFESIVPDKIFWRGEILYDDGAVQKVDISGNIITASVLGTRLYKVEAKIINDDFKFSCTCPYDGFCKHSIALGLWMVKNKSKLSKIYEAKDLYPHKPDISDLLKQATRDQKDARYRL